LTRYDGQPGYTRGATVEDETVDDQDDVDQALKLLHATGWCVGDTAFVTEAGTLVWLVSGRNGEKVIRAEGPTQADA
jgi:hypothetical protein